MRNAQYHVAPLNLEGPREKKYGRPLGVESGPGWQPASKETGT